MEPLLLTFKQASAALHISETSLRALIDRGDLPILRIGRSVRVPVTALREYVERAEARQDEKP